MSRQCVVQQLHRFPISQNLLFEGLGLVEFAGFDPPAAWTGDIDSNPVRFENKESLRKLIELIPRPGLPAIFPITAYNDQYFLLIGSSEGQTHHEGNGY